MQLLLQKQAELPLKLRFHGMHKLLEWLQWVHDGRSPSKWVSWYELLFSFQMHAGEWGIESTSSHNPWKIYSQIQSYDLKQTCRSWSSYLLQLIRFVIPGYKAENNRPGNSRFQCWAMGVQMHLSQRADLQIHEWLEKRLGSRSACKVSDLYGLPVAALANESEKASNGHGLHKFWQQR